MNTLAMHIIEGAMISILLIVWFNTTALVEYITLFRLDRFFFIKEYKEATQDDPGTSYPQYLVTNYNNFLTRLLSCPICLSVWFSLFINVAAFFILNITCLAIIPNLLVAWYFGVLGYFLLLKLMGYKI